MTSATSGAKVADGISQTMILFPIFLPYKVYQFAVCCSLFFEEMSWEVAKDREFYWVLDTETVSQEKIKFLRFTPNFNASSPRDRWVDAFDDSAGV